MKVKCKSRELLYKLTEATPNRDTYFAEKGLISNGILYLEYNKWYDVIKEEKYSYILKHNNNTYIKEAFYTEKEIHDQNFDIKLDTELE